MCLCGTVKAFEVNPSIFEKHKCLPAVWDERDLTSH